MAGARRAARKLHDGVLEGHPRWPTWGRGAGRARRVVDDTGGSRFIEAAGALLES